MIMANESDMKEPDGENCASCFYGRQPAKVGGRDALRCFHAPPVAHLVPMSTVAGQGIGFEFQRPVVAPDDVCSGFRLMTEAPEGIYKVAALENVAGELASIAKFIREAIGQKG